ncbi:MAG: TetR/AcrR family transcriptional regulator [Solirubrobacteraceae bacterium]|jgi:AcrR family transcriptional regulator
MPDPRDGRAERGEATRAALINAGRELFSERGYAAVGTNEVVQRAGVTRGAMYHHFPDKRELFRAVYEDTERLLVEGLGARIETIEDPWEALVTGMRSFFDVSSDPKLMQMGLIDGPAVLGWEAWRDIGNRYGLQVTTAALQKAMDAGVLRSADVTLLAHMLLAALGEAAMLLASSTDPRAERERVETTILIMLEGLRA